MRPRSYERALRRALAAAALLLAPLAAVADEVVIVNKSRPRSSMELAVVRDIFLGKKTSWDNGEHIVVVTLRKGPTHEAFLKKVVERTPAQFTNVWKQAIFTGTGVPPVTLETEGEVVKYVAATKGAIGYVDASTPRESVKVIEVR